MLRDRANLELKLPIGIEFLDSDVVGVRDVDSAFSIESDIQILGELSPVFALSAELLNKFDLAVCYDLGKVSLEAQHKSGNVGSASTLASTGSQVFQLCHRRRYRLDSIQNGIYKFWRVVSAIGLGKFNRFVN